MNPNPALIMLPTLMRNMRRQEDERQQRQRRRETVEQNHQIKFRERKENKNVKPRRS